jgi:hypothetical protein
VRGQESVHSYSYSVVRVHGLGIKICMLTFAVMILCTLGSVPQDLDAPAEVQVVSATTGSYVCQKCSYSAVCVHDQGINYVCGRQPNDMKCCKHEPTHLQGSILKFEGVSRSLSVRRSHQLSAIAWDSLLYWRKIDQRVNVVQSHTVVIVHLNYLLDLFLFTSCIYAWFGFLCCASYCLV